MSSSDHRDDDSNSLNQLELFTVSFQGLHHLQDSETHKECL